MLARWMEGSAHQGITERVVPVESRKELGGKDATSGGNHFVAVIVKELSMNNVLVVKAGRVKDKNQGRSTRVLS